MGALLSVCVLPARDWILGAVRRANDSAGGLRLGVAILSRQPRLIWFHLDRTGYRSVWEDEKRFERNFLDHYQRGLLIDGGKALLDGELVLPSGLASRGSILELPMHGGMQRLRIKAVREESHDYQRVLFEAAPQEGRETGEGPRPL